MDLRTRQCYAWLRILLLPDIHKEFGKGCVVMGRKYDAKTYRHLAQRYREQAKNETSENLKERLFWIALSAESDARVLEQSELDQKHESEGQEK